MLSASVVRLSGLSLSGYTTFCATHNPATTSALATAMITAFRLCRDAERMARHTVQFVEVKLTVAALAAPNNQFGTRKRLSCSAATAIAATMLRAPNE